MVLVISWGPGEASVVHDHRTWAVVNLTRTGRCEYDPDARSVRPMLTLK